MSIKLIASDMDGTLLNQYGEISAGNLEAIRQASKSGVQFCFSTGRSSLGVEPFARQLELGPDVPPYLILNGGASLRRLGETRLLRDITLGRDSYEEIRELAGRLHVCLLAYTDTVVCTEATYIGWPVMRELATVRMPLEYCAWSCWPGEQRFVKLQFCDEPEVIKTVYPQIPEAIREKYSVIWTNPYSIEISDPHASKGEALAGLSALLGLAPGEVMAIGDHTNDLSMIRFAGLGVAVANANETLLSAADAVVSDNDHDGVAEAISKYVL